MLRLEDIHKSYLTGDNEVVAVKDLSVNFRKNEFVSILGPSGCGKTTLLNIIGGLDRYTSGDLIIAGKSTKEYNDNDWDSYRNHTIGFVFQNYNLIMHLSVLDNVEMALILAGLNSKERKERAIEALKSVGLGEQIHKKPNQLSGGQMQRVAIARAIVNNPKIILADEPTGALDTETSIQVMDILKKLSEDKLIIMVTHNPEIAERYSTRIIKVLDGKVLNDSMPYSTEEEIEEIKCLGVADTSKIENGDGENKELKVENKENVSNENKDTNSKKDKLKKSHVSKKEKTSMSFFTALKLSLQNLRTKKARTILTSIAGSIGIIGVALIVALSSGFNNYIDKMQMDTLSNYPLTIEQNAVDYSSFNSSLFDENKNVLDKVYVNKMLEKMLSLSKKNKITQEYIDNAVKTIDNSLYYDIQYVKDAKLNIYREVNYSGYNIYQNVNNMIDINMGPMPMPSLWSELVDNKGFIYSQYDLVYGKYPETPTAENMDKEHQVVLVLDEKNEISDMVLNMLGWKELKDSYSYEELVGTTFKLILNNDYYSFDSSNEVFVKNSKVQGKLETIDKSVYDKGVDLKIVGILRLSENSSMGSIQSSIGYLSSLTNYILDKEESSNIVVWQKEHKDKDCLLGKNFEGSEEEKSLEYDKVLRSISGEKLPSKINIYPKDFNAKEDIKNHLDDYNKNQSDKSKKVYYTDVMDIMVSTLNTMVNSISYVLIGFTSISLLVSSLMIGIITYVSVLERTKEIGILRSIGARKKDVSRVFNAETLIIGFASGIIGVVFTLIVSIPINILLKSVVDIANLCVLPFISALILIILSMGLTFVSGLIPARIASKKDPVLALRSE